MTGGLKWWKLMRKVLRFRTDGSVMKLIVVLVRCSFLVTLLRRLSGNRTLALMLTISVCCIVTCRHVVLIALLRLVRLN